MELTTIAKPYAKAVFSHSSEKGLNEKWLDFFAAIECLFSNNQLLDFVCSPKLNATAKFDFLVDLLKKTLKEKITQEQQNFMQLILKNDRVEVLPEIALNFRALLSSSGKERLFTIISAYKLSDSEEKSLLKSLSAKFDCNASIEVEIQKDLIGGVIVKDGDRIIDGSVNAQLRELSYCLS